ncbi:hypothetical protein CIPAW_16G079100 [Carya illinoinensis]|uniref:Uncharacterized protein n=1 Tax=Carya illinoinensis TaxID=32201 RepID=A0A8T1N830_CARIL|nr:hypothetical protein CIPAW_16G079100 [Carya illinoinensis]
MRDKRVVEKSEDCTGDYMVACSFKNIVDEYQWAFASVYGPNLDCAGSVLWDELAGLSSIWDFPWCIGGNFNITRFSSEQSGGSSFNSPMVDFSNFIYEQDLLDIPLTAGTYTWSSNREHPTWSRINKFLVSPEWEDITLNSSKRDSPGCA